MYYTQDPSLNACRVEKYYSRRSFYFFANKQKLAMVFHGKNKRDTFLVKQVGKVVHDYKSGWNHLGNYNVQHIIKPQARKSVNDF